MAKPNPLQLMASQVAESMEKPTTAPAAPPAPKPIKPAPVAPEEDAPPKPAGQASREGKKFLGVYIDPVRHEEIKQAAFDEGLQVQELVRDAIDAWMAEHGQEAIKTVAARHQRRSQRSR